MKRPTPRAFSILEMVVAMTILLVGLSIAGQLLTEVYAHIAWAGGVVTDQAPDQACDQLRLDIHASTGDFGGSSIFTTDPLIMQSHARVVSYVRVGGVLERRLLDPSTGEETSRPALNNVMSFRWRGVGRGVEVEIVSWRDAPPPFGPVTAGGQRSRERIVHRDIVLIAPRRVTTASF